MKFPAILALALLPSFASAHSMSPGFETELAPLSTFVKTYDLFNTYPHPAVFEMQVFEKDWTPAEGWKAEKPFYKLFPDNVAEVKVKFRVGAQRKLYVCSVLKEIDVHGTTANMISRVCSRLIINPVYLPDAYVEAEAVSPKDVNE